MRRRWLAAGAAVTTLAGIVLWRLLPATGDTLDLPVARHETRDIAFRPIFIAGLLTLAGLAGIGGLAAWLYPQSRASSAVTTPLPSFPQPVLQPDTGADMASLRAEQMRALNGVYWLDHEHNIVHLPIDAAMREVATHGIPDWPAAPARQR